MKGIAMSGLALLISFSLTGCTSTGDIGVNFENYYYKDTEDGSEIEEFIEVSIDANEISDYTVKQIMDSMESKNLDTNVIVSNMQGVQIAKLKESNKKVSIDIDKNYKSRKKSGIILKNGDVFREMTKLQRDIVEDTTMKEINKLMENFSSLSESLGKRLENGDIVELSQIFSRESGEGLGLDQIINKSKEIKDNEKFTKAKDILIKTNESYIKSMKSAKEYQENKTQENLKKFKSAILELRRHVATYQVQINSLDGEDLSLTEQFTN